MNDITHSYKRQWLWITTAFGPMVSTFLVYGSFLAAGHDLFAFLKPMILITSGFAVVGGIVIAMAWIRESKDSGHTKEDRPEAQNPVQVRAQAALTLLSTLPQFTVIVRLGTGSDGAQTAAVLLNMLNGCLVSKDEQGLRLTWQRGSYETPAHSALLSEEGAIDKFVAVMEWQANSVQLDRIGNQQGDQHEEFQAP